ncbi:nucleotidyltransferase family protein [Rummeliibacillus suwonensis]|uniref:nucleotidyltransferase family protein n=1 Tax=Rummeliibacillus suwonensis TaxID=1306154 RepID=UPI001AAF889F|nr:nucleotidyltransferase family protein [Rummeliibacillus suwonensis]MBO2534271.1 nucleotidyltransferase family protein [Rummeliibacillus suwonensis]
MKKFNQIIVNEKMSIIETMKVIDKSALQFVAVVNLKQQLIGTVTDGDIRRGILKGISLEKSIVEIMNSKPIFLEENTSIVYQSFMKLHKLKQLPIVNNQHEIIDIIFSDYLNDINVKPNKVVLMVGGLGTRLRPLTEHIPKPMLKVGNKPILETIVEGFKNYGFVNFVFCVNYKKEIIQDYFQDGSAFGVHIEYVEEKERMGTAGALSLLTEKPKDPFFVMNGDLLTQINFDQLLNFHLEHNSAGTMCVRKYEYQIPFGVIETDEHKLVSILEKPMKEEYVNAGIYVLNPEVLELIPHNSFYDMPELFNTIIEAQRMATVFPIREYWMDIGRLADYEKANNDYESVNNDE